MEAMGSALIQPYAKPWIYMETGQPQRSAAPLHASPDEDAETRARVKEQIEVVLAEDNTGDVLLVREALQAHDIRVHLTVHRDGEQMCRFIEKIDRGDAPCPQLVLLDLNLPRQNGRSILAQIRRSPVCGHLPVIVVSSSDSPDDREAVARLGATRYFRKPSDFDEFMKLGDTVRDVLRLGSLPR